MKYFSKANIKSLIAFTIAGSLILSIPQAFSFTKPQNIPNPILQSAHYQKLMKEASEGKTVRVIVGLNTKNNSSFLKKANTRQLAQSRHQAVKKLQNNFLFNLASQNIKVISPFKYIPFIALEVDKNTLEKIANMEAVTSIEEDEKLEPLLDEVIPFIGIDDAWAAGYTGAGYAVAVIDSGVDHSHTMFTDKIVSETCITYLSCPDGSSYMEGPGVAEDCDPLSIQGCGHGTGVSSVALGSTAYDPVLGVYLTGAAKDAKLVAIDIGSIIDDAGLCGSNPTPCMVFYTANRIDGQERVYELQLEYLYPTGDPNELDMPIAAVNMSLGSTTKYSTEESCDAAYPSTYAVAENLSSVGVVNVAGSGNDGLKTEMSAPACVSNIVSVGASNNSDVVQSWSNSASFLDLLAPGHGVRTASPYNTFAGGSGTSISTAFVSGSWAILKQRFPQASVEDILNIFKSTGVLLTDSANGVITPRIDVGTAVSITCSAPGSGTWTISNYCQIGQSASHNGNVVVTSSGVLSILDGVSLNLDLQNYSLRVEQGGKVWIADTAKIY